MLECKIDHNEPEALPLDFCRACNPGKFKPFAAAVPSPLEAEQQAADLAKRTERMDRRKRRKLRAECKRLQDEIDKIGGRNPPVTAKLEKLLSDVRCQLHLVS